MKIEAFKNRAYQFPAGRLPQLAPLLQNFRQVHQALEGFEMESIWGDYPVARQLFQDCLKIPHKEYYWDYEVQFGDPGHPHIQEILRAGAAVTAALGKFLDQAPVGQRVGPWKVKRTYLKHAPLWDHFRSQRDEIQRRYGVELSGCFYYPPGGFREWHSNARHDQGWRMYYCMVSEPGGSSFQYLDARSGQVQRLMDRDDHFNLFYVTGVNEVAEGKRPDYFWHSVYSETHRASLGMRVSEALVEDLIRRNILSSGA